MDRDMLRERTRHLPIIANMSDQEFELLLQDMSQRDLDPGEVFIVEGDVATSAYLILEGEVEILRSAGDRDVVVANRHAGELVGEMALLMEARRNATVRAVTPSTIVEITAAAFKSVLASNPETAIGMLRSVWTRLHDAEAHLVQHQKMAALGTLAAGLAHELNNPASALVRSSNQLASTIESLETHAMRLGELQLSDRQYVALREVRSELAENYSNRSLDSLARADLEEEVAGWLTRKGVDSPWLLAPVLVEAGQSPEELENIASTIDAETVSTVLWWLGTGALASSLLRELTISGSTISEIVSAVKGYTRLDQAPVQETDIHEGIEQALVILRHKLKNIRITREYADDIPRIVAYASELNQVWTNLIDNAAQAMEGDGSLTIRTRLEACHIVVDVEDSGPGIPEEAQDRIFDSFYTTKAPGQGTGLGLTISFNIIRRHGGDIRLSSRPGCTRFSVHLPVEGGIQDS